MERQKKRRNAERVREARKKGIKVEELPEDPPEPVLPSTYTGQVRLLEWALAKGVVGAKALGGIVILPAFGAVVEQILLASPVPTIPVIPIRPASCLTFSVLCHAAAASGTPDRFVPDAGQQAAARHRARHTRTVGLIHSIAGTYPPRYRVTILNPSRCMSLFWLYVST